MLRNVSFSADLRAQLANQDQDETQDQDQDQSQTITTFFLLQIHNNKESVFSLKEKQHNIGFPTFKLPASTKNSFMTDPFNIVFVDFGI